MLSPLKFPPRSLTAEKGSTPDVSCCVGVLILHNDVDTGQLHHRKQGQRVLPCSIACIADLHIRTNTRMTTTTEMRMRNQLKPARQGWSHVPPQNAGRQPARTCDRRSALVIRHVQMSATAVAAPVDTDAFIATMNDAYEKVHKEYEDNFWSTKMALKACCMPATLPTSHHQHSTAMTNVPAAV
ncbi:peptidase_M3 domain-containing protein [Haematococcus lacustris]|uniref:Peptidase_M3 domain-containing protein n=1 Tax=Haematococcus lacustris TaxID=44745 RepID=A0A699YS46_HAELA|nr:peptidase_M3 domain-containing protein [Haematococcus lacustris]